MIVIIGKFIGKIVRRVEQHARVTVLILGLLTLAAGVYSSLFTRIDSDLGKLIKPSADTRWYQDNERYKRAFPDSQQTAVIVVSGDIQPEAHTRVKNLGALEFIKKPTSQEALIELLEKFGYIAPPKSLPLTKLKAKSQQHHPSLKKGKSAK